MTLATPSEAPESTARGTSPLLSVLRVIPPECYRRSTARGLAYLARSIGIYAVALGALAVSQVWWLVLPLWLLAGLAVAGLFVLAHDAAHGALFDSARLNRRVGRALMVPSLHVYESWVVGHNRIHHGHTLRQGMDFVWHPVTVEEYRTLGPLGRIGHRIEWSPFGAGLYYLRAVWWDKMMRFTPPKRYRDAVRRDERFLAVCAGTAVLAVAVLGWLSGGGPLGAIWLVTKLFAVPFVVFAYVIGFAVYVHHIAPDIKWWSRRAWTSYHGQVEGTTVLHVPRVLDVFFHHIFVHVPHHVDVRLPCYALPAAAEAIIAAFPDVDHRDFRWRDYLASTRACKLYDFDEQRWLTYAAAG